MSRTKKGTKYRYSELWSKRASKAGVVGRRPSSDNKTETHRHERRVQAKEAVNEAVAEARAQDDVDRAIYLHVIDDEC